MYHQRPNPYPTNAEWLARPSFLGISNSVLLLLLVSAATIGPCGYMVVKWIFG